MISSLGTFKQRFRSIGNHLLFKNFLSVKQTSSHNHFIYGTHMIPHLDKVQKGGEDAYYHSKNLIAIADGVGGWADHGVDPAKHSRTLCQQYQDVADIVEKEWEKFMNLPKQVLIEAASRTMEVGSSTLAIINLDESSPILYSAHVGDSGYMIFRKEQEELRMIFQSPEQQKGFNFPYQLGTQGDSPSVAIEYSHEVRDNDIVVVGSDGLFDNLDGRQIGEILKTLVVKKDELESAEHAAQLIAEIAFKFSLNPQYPSPFSKKAKEIFLRFNGGKSDDITVSVAQIKLNSYEKKK